MRTNKKVLRLAIAITLVLSMLVSVCVCAIAAGARETSRAVPIGASTYYFYGLNSNSPDFGSLKGPTGSMTYDTSKGYYYYDVSGTGDYCFVISTVSGNGTQAVKSPAIGGVAQAGNYYLSQGNYNGYVCMHLWNPSGDTVRVYFTSTSAGLYAVKAGSDVVTPTQSPATSAPTQSSGSSGYIYCENAAGWSTVNAYMWLKDTETKNAAWPGVAMTKVSGNIWRYQVPSGLNMIIFNNGSAQTADLSYPGAGYIYNNQTGQWSLYGGSTDPTQSVMPTGAQPTTTPVTPTQPSGSQKLVFLENEAGWTNVTAYMWNSENDKNAGWPGVNMTNIGGKIWQYAYAKDFANIIFSQGGQNQTSDLKFPGAGYIYNNKTGEWSIYDTSPLQVQSFTTDLASPQYSGTAIALSAKASGVGNVYYRFSVTNNTTRNTAVLSDYSTKSAVLWTPTVVGTYTLNFEFKDNAGNTNKRTLSYTIENDSAVAAPIIKSVTPGSAQILNGKSCSISVNAGGGIVGTNLLFYKYTIKDSTGKTVNTPYYTRNRSYSFTPAALGYYTLTVTVQASDNGEASRSYTLQSVNQIDDDTPVIVPTESDPGSATYLKGDADGDGEMTVLDATRIQRVLARLVPMSDLNFKNADTDEDNDLTILDATRIQRKLARLSVENW